MQESKSARLVRWAKAKRKELFRVMGGRCAECKTRKDLQFDHPNGRDYDPARLSRWSRMTRYIRDWKAGNLRPLCGPCNRRDGGGRRYSPYRATFRPDTGFIWG